MAAPRGPVRSPGLRVTVNVYRRTNRRRLKKLHRVLFRHPDASMGIRVAREKSGVQTDRWLKLDVIPHRRLHELQPARDLFIDISVWNDDLFRHRIAKEAVKARGVVDIFVRHPKI